MRQFYIHLMVSELLVQIKVDDFIGIPNYFGPRHDPATVKYGIS